MRKSFRACLDRRRAAPRAPGSQGGPRGPWGGPFGPLGGTQGALRRSEKGEAFPLGNAVASNGTIRNQVRLAQEALLQLTESFEARAPFLKDLAQQTPRADNAAADECANIALDTGSFSEYNPTEMSRFLLGWAEAALSDDIGILFAFDGASRGNPGEAALGVCAWWGSWSPQQFHVHGMILRKGLALGRRTNNYAEARGMAMALKEALRMLFSTLHHLIHT